ncbi:hypothetical protein EXIGLDRAFT_722544 [Exidia glandulosa HHB12029]|uniref:Uncharacterized protein n=1 Tax=Exidia glandulosa HHB12029 TaxID=1314781 RepID=A0A165F8L7_EXIGL|nr:hypothetical protein EXIGLDRAFT_722544 [Exidia glandulosa HHB12029]
MYGRSRAILIANAVIFVVLLAAAGAIVGIFFPQEIFIPFDTPVVGSCYVYIGAALSMGLLPPLLFTLWLTALAIWKWREYKLGKVRSTQGSSLMSMLVQSNLAYLLLLSGAIATVLSIQVHIKFEPSSAPIALLTAAAGIGGTRLTLSLRKEVLTPPQSKASKQSRHRHQISTLDDRIVVHKVTTIIRDDDLDMDVFPSSPEDDADETRTIRTEAPDPSENEIVGVYRQWLQLPGTRRGSRRWSRTGPAATTPGANV